MSMQAVSAATAQQAMPAETSSGKLPDIEIRATLEIDEVKIERDGDISLVLSGAPVDEKNTVVTRNKNAGSRNIRDLQIDVQSGIRLADPAKNVGSTQNSSTQNGSNQNEKDADEPS